MANEREAIPGNVRWLRFTRHDGDAKLTKLSY